MFDMEKYCVAAEIALLMVLKGALQGWMEAVQAGDNSWPCTSSSFLSSYRTKYLPPVLSIKPQTLPHSGTTKGIEWIPHPLWHWCIVRKTEKNILRASGGSGKGDAEVAGGSSQGGCQEWPLVKLELGEVRLLLLPLDDSYSLQAPLFSPRSPLTVSITSYFWFSVSASLAQGSQL